jgi:poly-gamma-glutamate synthesis protein (capsule biosynthesis protein)
MHSKTEIRLTASYARNSLSRSAKEPRHLNKAGRHLRRASSDKAYVWGIIALAVFLIFFSSAVIINKAHIERFTLEKWHAFLNAYHIDDITFTEEYVSADMKYSARKSSDADLSPGLDLSLSLEPDGGSSIDSSTGSSADSDVNLSADLGADLGADRSDGLSAYQSVEQGADETKEPIVTSITISAGGDCTLGMEYRSLGANTFAAVFREQDMDFEYFFRGLRDVFDHDDLTIVNLEGALTDASDPADKQFVFKGSPSYAKILSSSGIEAVSLANNHTMDYRQSGYDDTIRYLDDEGIVCFGNERKFVLDVNGVNVGLYGYHIQNDSIWQRARIKSAIEELREAGARLIIAYYHWGEERSYQPNSVQTGIGRFSVDCGADLVLGAHPHVIQGIEEYNGRNIVYSLANLCFGGNQNPDDKDSFIYQQTFFFSEGELLEANIATIIPVSVSSTRSRNDYQPAILTGNEAERVLRKIRDASTLIQ